MANYSPTNFLVPISSEDKTIQIRDISGVVRYNVNPCNVVSSFVTGNLIKIRSLSTDYILTLDFDTVNFAKSALTQFQQYIETIKANHPCASSNVNPNIGSLTFHQFTASMTWSFVHNLDRKPSVFVYDYNGYEIGALIKTGNPTVSVYFNKGMTGSVYLV